MFASYPILCMVTPGRVRDAHDSGEAARLLVKIAAAAQAGMTLVQIREPQVDTRALAALVAAAMRAVEGTGARLVVNDRLDVAIACAAHGVHLKERSLPPARARAIAPRPFIIGRSIHAAEDAAANGHADYLLFGTVFDTGSKGGARGQGVHALRAAVAAASVPVLAIGGMTEARLPAVRAAGAAGFAAISYFDVPPALMAERCTRARRQFDTSEPVP